MKKVVLTLGLALASLLAANAYAQADVPGEARAAKSEPATKAEKAEAKAARKSEGKKVAKATKSHADASPDNMGTAKAHSKAERKAAAAERKAAGKAAAKEPKDPTTGAGGTN